MSAWGDIHGASQKHRAKLDAELIRIRDEQQARERDGHPGGGERVTVPRARGVSRPGRPAALRAARTAPFVGSPDERLAAAVAGLGVPEFALDPSSDQAACLRRQFGGRRYARNWAVRTLKADLDRYRVTGEDVASRAECEIAMANQQSLSAERELTENLLAIVLTFSCRLYGLRRYRKTLQTALTEDVAG